MEVLVENTSALGRRLKISVPEAKVREQYQAKLSQFAREAHLKGFRPGKVPLTVVQKKFGRSLRREVVETLVQESLTQAFKDQSLRVAGLPSVESLQNESDKDLEFTATLEVYPEIVLADLTGLEYEKRVVTIEEADVQTIIAKFQRDFGTWAVVERPVALGDKLRVDFARLFHGATESERKEQNNVEMIVELKRSVPGLAEALLGKQVGETCELDVTYPSDWTETEAAGKAATLWTTIHAIHENKPLTEEELIEKLAIQADKGETLFSVVKQRMEQELENMLREDLKEKVLEILLEKNPIEVPKALIEQEKEAIRQELSQQYRKALPREAMEVPEIQTQAIRRVELGLLLNKVIERYEIKAERDAINAAIEKLVARFPTARAEQMRELYWNNRDALHTVERMVLLEQAVDVMLAEMKPKEVNTTFDQVTQIN